MGSPRRSLALALLIAGGLGCFVDDPTVEGAATSQATATSPSSSSSSSTTSTSTSTSSASASESEASGSTTAPAPVCGDGVVDPGEACDDGNASELDACLTTCELATCSDGLRSQDESDVDCGGGCPPCPPCGACVSDDECAAGTCDPDEARCVVTFDVTIDYLANCGMGGDASDHVLVDVAAGDYLAEAVPGSAGSVWSPPYNPPARGWAWRAPCSAFDFAAMRTPPGIYYATPDEAFAALMAPSELITLSGAPFTCGLDDSACSDNQGSVHFTARSHCD